MRRAPAAVSTTRPASFSTLRCCETAGRLTGSSRASSPPARGRSASRSRMARRVGSPRAASPSVVVWLAMTYGKAKLTNYHHRRVDLSLTRIEAAVEEIDPVFLNTPQFVDERLSAERG